VIGRPLFHGNRFGQVARLVNVASAAHGNVIRQQLQRHHFQDWQQQFRRVSNVNDMVD
jgi:hypothetical protein